MAVSRKRERMPVAQRAKQFAPFKCLTGLEEALKEREELHRKKYEAFRREAVEELTPEDAEQIEEVWDEV